MKRVGYILEQIADFDNLLAADKEAQSGKVKKNRYIRRHNERQEEDLKALQQMLLNGTFQTSAYTTMIVHSCCGKDREIFKLPYFPDRVLHHAIIRVIEPYMNKNLIYLTFACIKGKGLHFGVRQMKRILKDKRGTSWCIKTDFKKFYQSVPHEVILMKLRKHFKDERFLSLMDNIIRSYDSGVAIQKMIYDEELRKERLTDWAIH